MGRVLSDLQWVQMNSIRPAEQAQIVSVWL